MLTTFEAHALTALQGTGYRNEMPPSAVGQMLWERSDPETRKRRPSPQGLALFASKFLRGLKQAGLARQNDGWYITHEGREALVTQSDDDRAAQLDGGQGEEKEF